MHSQRCPSIIYKKASSTIRKDLCSRRERGMEREHEKRTGWGEKKAGLVQLT